MSDANGTLGTIATISPTLKGSNHARLLLAFSERTLSLSFLELRSLRSLTLGFISLSPLATRRPLPSLSHHTKKPTDSKSSVGILVNLLGFDSFVLLYVLIAQCVH